MNNTFHLLKSRIYAFSLDIFFIMLLSLVIYTNLILLLRLYFLNLNFSIQIFLLQFIYLFPTLIFFSMSFFYFSSFYFLTNGKTFGKKVFQISLQTNHKKLSVKKSCIRAFTINLTILFGSFLFIIPFLRKDTKSLADILSNTNHSKL